MHRYTLYKTFLWGCEGCRWAVAGRFIISQSQSAVRREPCVGFGNEARSEGDVKVRWMECPSSLRFLPQLCIGLPLYAGRSKVLFGLWQLCDVKHLSDAQVELSQDGPQLGDQVELHDLA